MKSRQCCLIAYPSHTSLRIKTTAALYFECSPPSFFSFQEQRLLTPISPLKPRSRALVWMKTQVRHLHTQTLVSPLDQLSVITSIKMVPQSAAQNAESTGEDFLCCYLKCSTFHPCGLETPNGPGIVTWYVSSKENCQSSVPLDIVFITFSKSSEDGDVGHFLCDCRFDEGKTQGYGFFHYSVTRARHDT